MGHIRLKLSNFVLFMLATSSVNQGVGPDIQSPNFKTREAKAHFEKAMQYSEKSNWNGTVLELNRAHRLEPRNAAILIELGIAFGELQQWDQAVKILNKAIELAPGSFRAHYNLGVTLDRANPGKGYGTAEYRKAVKLNPRDVACLINLAANVGDQNREEATGLVTRALVLDPKSAEAHFNLGLLRKKAGDSKGAVAAFQKAIELDSEFLEPRRQLAFLLVTQEKWDATIKHCQEILKRHANDWNIRYTLGQTLIRQGKTEEGRRELQKAQETRQSQQKREEVEKLLGRGVSNLTSGRVEHALKDFHSALEIDERSVPAHTYLGVALANAGNPDRGIKELNKAIDLDPQNARAHHNLGTVLLQSGQIQAASHAFEKALELDPYFAETHNNLGLIFSQSHQVEKAIEHFQLASELNPQYLEALFNLGLALRSSNRIQEAIQAFRRAAEVAPDNPQVHYALGETLKEKGDTQGAAEALNRASLLQQGKRPTKQ